MSIRGLVDEAVDLQAGIRSQGRAGSVLQDHTQASIAKKLKIKQPSVHQRLQAAGWPVVQKILTRFESVIPNV